MLKKWFQAFVVFVCSALLVSCAEGVLKYDFPVDATIKNGSGKKLAGEKVQIAVLDRSKSNAWTNRESAWIWKDASTDSSGQVSETLRFRVPFGVFILWPGLTGTEFDPPVSIRPRESCPNAVVITGNGKENEIEIMDVSSGKLRKPSPEMTHDISVSGSYKDRLTINFDNVETICGSSFK